MTAAQRLTARLLRALDEDYNVVDMHAIAEVISDLENIDITKELLETTRLGKHVNELRRRTNDAALARRAKILLKRWRDMIIPDKSGQSSSAESNVRQSPYTGSGVSPIVAPSVTPRLGSPQVIQGSHIGHHQGHHNRQPLTSPAALHHNLKNSSQTTIRNSPPSFRNVASGHKSSSSSAHKSLSPGVSIVSPALRIPSQTVSNVTPSKDPYDSDSNDVILVDDDDVKPVAFGSNSSSTLNYERNDKYSKKPRSPINGRPDAPLPGEELRRGEKRERRESGSRKSKKRRNHTKSENTTIDHSVDIVSVESPFLPISSASTSPALSMTGNLRNGLSSTAPVIIEDVDAKPSAPAVADSSKSKSSSTSSSSRKNGCKKSPVVDVNDYSNFIKNKIPTSGRKVKTTKELLEEMQARKTGKFPSMASSSSVKKSKPKKDFLATYDSKKRRGEPIVTDIIELNDSNSGSSKDEASSHVDDVDEDNKITKKFEPVDVILSRLPPVETRWSDADEFFAPVCTCAMLYEDDLMDLPIPKASIFKSDFEDEEAVKTDADTPNYKEQIDPDCQALVVYQRKPAEVAHRHIEALHNDYIADVNGSKCEISLQLKSGLACRMNAWGLRPYYDCARDLFHSVVPKYNYLDYSLDRCVKNFQNVILEKYAPAECAADGSDWYLSLEREHFEKWKDKRRAICDEDDYPSDSPFSEKGEDDDRRSSSSPDVVATTTTDFDSDIKISVSDNNNSNLDRDIEISGARSSTAIKKEAKKTAEAKKEVNPIAMSTAKSNRFEILEYTVEIQYRPFSTLYSKCIFLDDVDFANETSETGVREESAEEPVAEIADPLPKETPRNERFIKPGRVFNYEDEVSLLPLSLPALNAPYTYSNAEIRNDSDLSCVFNNRVKGEDEHADSVPTYESLNSAQVLEMRHVTNSARRRTTALNYRSGIDLDDGDANFSVDPPANSNEDTKPPPSNCGALVVAKNDEEKCVNSGCPSWIPASGPKNPFREWHEPVVRTSYKEEALTILPYVVID